MCSTFPSDEKDSSFGGSPSEVIHLPQRLRRSLMSLSKPNHEASFLMCHSYLLILVITILVVQVRVITGNCWRSKHCSGCWNRGRMGRQKNPIYLLGPMIQDKGQENAKTPITQFVKIAMQNIIILKKDSKAKGLEVKRTWGCFRNQRCNRKEQEQDRWATGRA